MLSDLLKTKTANYVKFILYSISLAALLFAVFRKLNMIGGILIIGNGYLSESDLTAFFFFTWLLVVLLFLLVCRIKRKVYKKLFASSCFPVSVISAIRLSLVAGIKPVIIYSFFFVGLLPLIYALLFDCNQPWLFLKKRYRRKHPIENSKAFKRIQNYKRYRRFIKQEFIHSFLDNIPDCIIWSFFAIVFINVFASSTATIERSFEEKFLCYEAKLTEFGLEANRPHKMQTAESLELAIRNGPFVYARERNSICTKGDNIYMDNREAMSGLQKDVYPTLSIEEKLRYLQTLADLESQVLFGKKQQIQVMIGVTDEKTGGYSDPYGNVVISFDQLQRRDAAVQTIFHESRHIWQETTLALLEKANAFDTPEILEGTEFHSWKVEMENYIRPEQNLQGYHAQRMEQDAYVFGTTKSYVFCLMLDESSEYAAQLLLDWKNKYNEMFYALKDYINEDFEEE